MPSSQYYDLIAASKYVVSPAGDRPDTYRHYECIGLGSIPIANINETLYSFFGKNMMFMSESDILQSVISPSVGMLNSKVYVDRSFVLSDTWVSRVMMVKNAQLHATKASRDSGNYKLSRLIQLVPWHGSLHWGRAPTISSKTSILVGGHHALMISRRMKLAPADSIFCKSALALLWSTCKGVSNFRRVIWSTRQTNLIIYAWYTWRWFGSLENVVKGLAPTDLICWFFNRSRFKFLFLPCSLWTTERKEAKFHSNWPPGVSVFSHPLLARNVHAHSLKGT
jgi:hypothetical protein